MYKKFIFIASLLIVTGHAQSQEEKFNAAMYDKTSKNTLTYLASSNQQIFKVFALLDEAVEGKVKDMVSKANFEDGGIASDEGCISNGKPHW